jgi:hypothetical protein
MKKSREDAPRRSPPLNKIPADPLLRALFARAQARGDTLTELAQHLGVSYERVAQWRRAESPLKTARRDVHQRAARYLEVPVLLIFALAGIITLDDFSRPVESEPLEAQLDRELADLRLDPFYGAFMPESLLTASLALKQYVLLMYREIQREPWSDERRPKWMKLLHQVAEAVQVNTNTPDAKR